MRTDKLDDQINVRVPRWLKTAVESAAEERSRRGVRVHPSDVAREILWPHFEAARPQAETATTETAGT